MMNIFRRWNVTHRKLILGHQLGKWYQFVILCFEYLIDYAFYRPLVDVGPASECWMDLCTQLAGKIIRWFIVRWSDLTLQPKHGVP